jgi:hypothetical protein
MGPPHPRSPGADKSADAQLDLFHYLVHLFGLQERHRCLPVTFTGRPHHPAPGRALGQIGKGRRRLTIAPLLKKTFRLLDALPTPAKGPPGQRSASWSSSEHITLSCPFTVLQWDFYDQLLTYRQQPDPEEWGRLETEFDRLFSTCTGYDALDTRIAKTREKKVSLLMVLKHPEIPLHNNPFYQYIHDRISKTNQIPALASLIEARASELALGASWSAA